LKEFFDMTLDAPYLAELREMPPRLFFVMGCQRSGTTFLYQTLAASGLFKFLSAYDVIRYEELLHNRKTGREATILQALDAQIRTGADTRGMDVVNIGADAAEEYGFILPKDANRFLFVPQLTPKNLPRFVELCRKKQFLEPDRRPLLLKNPDDFFGNFLYIAEQFPDARMMFIHRHPRDTFDSNIRAWRFLLREKNAYQALLAPGYARIFDVPAFTEQARRALESEAVLTEMFRSIATACAYYVQNIERLPPGYSMSLRYEDLCSRPVEQFSRVFEFLGLPIPANARLSADERRKEHLPIADKIYREQVHHVAPYLEVLNYDA
jgi:hypothetical protein